MLHSHIFVTCLWSTHMVATRKNSENTCKTGEKTLYISLSSAIIEMRHISTFLFLCGFVVGNIPGLFKVLNFETQMLHEKLTKKFVENDKVSSLYLSNDELYDESLSQKMFHEVNILCWVFTHSANHKNKSIHIKNLWAKRCNKVLFISNEEDSELGTVALPVPNGRRNLWNKTIATYQYVTCDLFKTSRIKFDFLMAGSQASPRWRRLVYETRRWQVRLWTFVHLKALELI